MKILKKIRRLFFQRYPEVSPSPMPADFTDWRSIRIQELKEENQELKDKIADLEEENNDLQHQIDELSSREP